MFINIVPPGGSGWTICVDKLGNSSTVLRRSECLGKHSCMSTTFPIVILNDTSFFPTVQLQVHKRESGVRWRH